MHLLQHIRAHDHEHGEKAGCVHMADAIKEWVKDIIILVVCLGFIETMLPYGGLRRVVRVVVGISIMGAILSPIPDIQAAIFRSAADLSRSDFLSTDFIEGRAASTFQHLGDVQSYVERGAKVAQAGTERIRSGFKEQVERQARAIALLASRPRDARVSVEVSPRGEIHGIKVILFSPFDGEGNDRGAQTISNVAMAISDFYSIDPSLVKVAARFSPSGGIRYGEQKTNVDSEAH